MDDREKVIKELQEAVDWLSTETSPTVVDQWVVRDALALLKAQEPEALDAQKQDGVVGCWYDITHNYTLEQVVSALKAQEPRVMTLEEVRDEAEYMFLEKHSATGSDLYGCAIRGDWDGYGIELLISEYDYARERWENYGKTWRCWTSRPTDEQREATPWE